MLILLKTEWLKYKHYRTFWFLSLAFTGLLALFYCAVSFGWIHISSGGMTLLDKASSFAQVWDDLCFFASYFIIILSILVIILQTNEVQFRTNRQNIIDGWTRLQFYHLKWVVIIGISVATTLFVLLLGLLTGLLSGLPMDLFFHNFEKVLWLFLLSVNYLGFAFILSVFLKRSGLAIGVLMFYSLMIEMILHFIFLFKYHLPVGDLFLPLQTSDELLPSNAARLLKIGLKANFNPPEWLYALSTLIWIALYYLAGRRKLIKKDW